MKLRASLFAKIMLWFFLNLAVIGGVLFALFNLQFQLEPNSPLLGAGGDRIENIARAISAEIRDQSQTERDAILQRYSELYRLEFSLYTSEGEKVAGRAPLVPAAVLELIKQRLPEGRPAPPPPGTEPRLGDNRAAGRPFPVSTLKTSNPTQYWAMVRVPIYDPGVREPIKGALTASSDSITGNGIFFDPKPWLVIAAVVFGLSMMLWFPFVRSLTRTIKQLTNAAETIAEENFDVRVDEHRSDELGRLGKAINHLSGRLGGFVTGQKRFLGDISHELNSPLARMQFALSILEERTDEAGQKYIADVQEEVQLMAKLVAELLAYARAGLKTSEIRLSAVRLLPLIEQVVAREAPGFAVKIEVDEKLQAMVQPELLSRALANVIRNAVRYAGAAGPITIAAVEHEEQVHLTVADCGSGVSEEELPKLFDPFYRPETDRARETGGAGLGLAIVKTCIEACQGSVSARNLKPVGFEVSLELQQSS
ncbi:MAG: HAMP domain-containing sensor histidine kinase [Acidobacteriota bacterium]|nr:HAMP domain-containing sensor histidine kinase [Acidobacteriota bacterium]